MNKVLIEKLVKRRPFCVVIKIQQAVRKRIKLWNIGDKKDAFYTTYKAAVTFRRTEKFSYNSLKDFITIGKF